MKGKDNTSVKATTKLRQSLKHSIRKRTFYGSEDDERNQKHKVKTERRRQLQEMKKINPDAKMTDLPVDPFIYSRKTSEHYQNILDKVCKKAEVERPTNWKTITDAREYFTEYLKDRVTQCEAGKISPWTVRQEAAALAKALEIRTVDFGIVFPKRKREEITKNRTLVPENGFSEKFNEDCVLLAKAIGPRTNCELMRLKPCDFGLIPEEDRDENGRILIATKQWAGSYGVRVTGKTGKTRWVVVRPDLVEKVKETLEKYDPIKRIFTKSNNPVKARFPGHIYRREYARVMYGIFLPAAVTRFTDLVQMQPKLQKSKLVYYCRGSREGQVFFKDALQKCSWLLGHSRLDVVVTNYLDDEFSKEEAEANSQRIKEILGE